MTENRNASLDGLRGIAVLAVMCAHFTGPFQAAGPTIASKVLSAGWIGVDLFFALSGFLITRRLTEYRGSDAARLLSFWRNRALRIFPAYYLFLVACAVLDMTPGPSYWLYYCNWLQPWHDSEIYSIRSHLWSLSVEEQFYFLWPIAVIWLRPPALVKWCVGLSALAFVLRLLCVSHSLPPQFLYRATCFRMDALLCGAFAALVEPRVVKAVGCLGLFLAGGTLVVSRGLPFDEPLVQVVGFTGLALTFSWLVLAASGSFARRLLTRRWLVACGKYSYSAYLIHWPFAMSVWKRVTRAHLSLPATLALAVTEMALVMGAAALIYELIEKHFLRLKRNAPIAQSPALSVTIR